MSLDNALRSALVREGEAISADAASALPAIAGRARAQRRRRALQATAVVIAVATVVWAPPVFEAPLREERPRPARERHPDRSEGPVRDDAPPARTTAPGSVGRGSPRRDVERFGRVSATGGHPDGEETVRKGAGSPTTEHELGIVGRTLTERYEVGYVAGTHVSENAGGGCWDGEGTTGSNDCIAIQIGDFEHSISLSLVDDAGVLVGASVYHHVDGEGTDLVSFCGSTDGYVAVEPGALLLVYVDTSRRCSDQPPHFGTLTARIR